jgi:hypothetical protein
MHRVLAMLTRKPLPSLAWHRAVPIRRELPAARGAR